METFVEDISPENLRSLDDVPLEADPVLLARDMDELVEVGVVASAITQI
jgi:hypothetical protein